MKSVGIFVLAIIAVALTPTTAKSIYKPRIINGQNAKDGQFPHMVSLISRITMGHTCGASILSSRFLLTSAHCCQYYHAIPKNLYAVIGTIHQSSGGLTVELDRITTHKGFKFTDLKTGIYDVAVLRTAEEIIFTDLIQPIALPKENTRDDRHLTYVVAGWGLTGITVN